MEGKEYIFCAGKGECAFPEPFVEWRGTKQELPEALQRIEKTGDDRSFVLLSAMFAERYVESLIECIAPGFAKLNDNPNFGFSVKIEFLRSLRLIPSHIIRAADIMRRIRNSFAHGLDSESLDSCDEKLQATITQLVREVFGDASEAHFASARSTFRSLTFIALAGLQVFRPNFKKLREKLDDRNTVDAWKNECHGEFLAKMQALKQSPPIDVEVKDGWRYTRYPEGLVSIEAAGPDRPTAPAKLEGSGTCTFE